MISLRFTVVLRVSILPMCGVIIIQVKVRYNRKSEDRSQTLGPPRQGAIVTVTCMTVASATKQLKFLIQSVNGFECISTDVFRIVVTAYYGKTAPIGCKQVSIHQ